MSRLNFGLGALVWMTLATPLTCQAAEAAPDSVMGHFGNSVKMFRMYSGPDGMDRIEIANAPPPVLSPGITRFLDWKAQGVTMIAFPDGADEPWHVLPNRTLFIFLQGTLKLYVGDGKEYPISPGVLLLGEDFTGQGHSAHCDAKEAKDNVCLFMAINLGRTDDSKQK